MAKIVNNFPKIVGGLRKKAGLIVEATLHNIEARSKASMAAPKSGRFYGSHQASAPGEAPAVDTSNLINSHGVEMTSETAGIVYVTAEYAPGLEFGTRRIAPRPFLTPATEGERANFNNALRKIYG